MAALARCGTDPARAELQATCSCEISTGIFRLEVAAVEGREIL